MGARLDQHFLKSREAVEAIVEAAEIAAGDKVLEIGPGRGALTDLMLERGAVVTAIEKDRRLAEALERRAKGHPRLLIMTEDFLLLNLEELGVGPFKIVANLPYAVATPILQRILPWPHWTSAVLMFQKEVAERLVSDLGGPDYGLLRLSVMLRAEAKIVLAVPKELFAPPPKVDSVVVSLSRKECPLDAEGEKRFFQIARAAFGQRRKIAAGLIAGGIGRSKEEVAAFLQENGINPQARAQDIPLPVFLKLAGWGH